MTQPPPGFVLLADHVRRRLLCRRLDEGTRQLIVAAENGHATPREWRQLSAIHQSLARRAA